MRKSLLIAASNLRRTKGQTVAIVALILLASAMLNLGLMLSTDYKRNFDRCHDRLNDGHVTLSRSLVSPSRSRRRPLFQGSPNSPLISRYSVTYCPLQNRVVTWATAARLMSSSSHSRTGRSEGRW